MIRLLLYLLTGLLTSLFLFPFNLPITDVEVNTKMILAVVGAALFVWDKIRGRAFIVSKDFIILSVICALISVWSMFATLISGTSDYSFARYLISIWVWLGAAYAVVWIIRAVHGDADVRIVGNYLIGVCVAQCLVAYTMTVWPSWAAFVDGLMGEGESFMSATQNRMHGLGAALDPAGLRFSGVLVVIAFFLARLDFDRQPWTAVCYLASFFIITIVGNMIARTTTVGTVAAIILFLIMKWPRNRRVVFDRSWGILGGGFLVVILLSSWLYNGSPAFREHFRFGFEGFFSLVETGRWEVHSNEVLKGMIVWPESLKTWVMGDGFFENPEDLPDKFGQVRDGFYMRTDIGYLRFIFYFGCIGLLGMLAAFIQMTVTCVRNIKGCTLLFVGLLIVNLVGWLKVSSDIVMVFAPFLILAYLNGENEICTSSTT